MPFTRTLRRALALTGAAALAATLTPTVSGPQATAPPLVRDRIATMSYPTNAGKIFRWGNAHWDDDFIGPVKRAWAVNRPHHVDNQHGMLTMNGTAAAHTLTANLTGHGERYGRWETRVRAEQYGSAHTPYQVVAELVPVHAARYRCGARSIVLTSYRLGSHRAHMYIRNTPNEQFTTSLRRDLRPGPFHTYAVEVTRGHISWFVDTHVIMTERRADARSGARFAFRFRLVATRGARMNPGRMQMDWLRHYTLARHNARSIKAPHAVRGAYAAAC